MNVLVLCVVFVGNLVALFLVLNLQNWIRKRLNHYRAYIDNKDINDMNGAVFLISVLSLFMGIAMMFMLFPWLHEFFSK